MLQVCNHGLQCIHPVVLAIFLHVDPWHITVEHSAAAGDIYKHTSVPPDMKENHEKSMLIICSINESAIK